MVNTSGEKWFDYTTYALLALASVLAVFPLLYVVSVSITPMSEVLKNGGFTVIPKDITFEAYRQLLSDSTVPRAFGVSVYITALGTAISLVLTTLMAYPLSRKQVPGRMFFLVVVLFTMLFNGGLIPTYLIVKATGLLDTLWAMMIPNAIWAFNVLIMKSFFERLPNELFESARMDGAGEFRILLQMVLPLSLPVMLTIGLFYMVGNWNQFFLAVMFLTETRLYPLQLVVREILIQSNSPADITQIDVPVPTTTLQMASVVLVSLPMIAVYPFIQKYFTQGMLLGSVKG